MVKTLKIAALIFLGFLFGATFGVKSAALAQKFFRDEGHTIILNGENMSGFVYRNVDPADMLLKIYPSSRTAYRIDARGVVKLYGRWGSHMVPTAEGGKLSEDSLVAMIVPIRR